MIERDPRVGELRKSMRPTIRVASIAKTLLAVALVAASVVGCGNASQGDPLLGRHLTITDEPVLGQPGDEPASLSTLAPNGERVLLNFWASWCLPCRDEIPLLATYAPTAKRVVVVGVLYRDAEGPSTAAADELGATWPTLTDPDGSIAIQVPVNAAPLTLLLDATGVILDYRVGPFASVDEIKEFAEAP